MWEDSSYCWVVLCKNRWFHFRETLFNSHRIPLGETDAVMPLPALEGPFSVQCDVCGRKYLYRPSDVRKFEQELPESFTPHPLFRPGGERRRSGRSLRGAALVVSGESAETGAFSEETLAISANAHGALVVLSSKVALGQTLVLKNPRTNREIQGRVVDLVGPSDQGNAQVGVEFTQPAPDFLPVESRIGAKFRKKRKLGVA
jgi:hypothetical protein